MLIKPVTEKNIGEGSNWLLLQYLSPFWVAYMSYLSPTFHYLTLCYLHLCSNGPAYIPGFFFGRTPLIKLSPKKTWEGFIGGFFSTMVVAYYASYYLAQPLWLICPRRVRFAAAMSAYAYAAAHQYRGGSAVCGMMAWILALCNLG